MRHFALSLFGAAVSCLRFAVIAAMLAFITLPLMAQEQPIPAELSFLNKLGKPPTSTSPRFNPPVIRCCSRFWIC